MLIRKANASITRDVLDRLGLPSAKMPQVPSRWSAARNLHPFCFIGNYIPNK
jgi:hypothetical protein